MFSVRPFLLAAAFRVGLALNSPGAQTEPLGQCSRLTSLVISEIMYHPLDRPDGLDLEYIELFNSLDTPEDLGGYRLAGDVEYTFPPGTVIPGRAFLVVAHRPADVQSASGLTGVLGPFDNALPNDQGSIELRHRTGAVFLQIRYGTELPWPVAADGAGHSLVLARPSLGEGQAAAWAASVNSGGSPGTAEPDGLGPALPVLINEFLAGTDAPHLDYVELFNPNPREVNLSGWVLTDNARSNRFVLPPDTTIAAGGFLSFTQEQLGFALNSAGETLYLKDASQTRVVDAIRFGGQQRGVTTGRSPDGSDQLHPLEQTSPGTTNGRARVSDVVINEIMYHPITGEDDDQFVELFNRSAAPVDVSQWQLQDGLDFTFPANTIIPPQGYLVVARNAARLLKQHPRLDAGPVAGDFSGRLARGGERIRLAMPVLALTSNPSGQPVTNVIHVVVDEVSYQDGGRWGQWSDGGGSSLERIDPQSDGRVPSNWADSDESGKAPWTTVSFTGRLDNGNVTADQLQVLLQGAGECLVDEVEVLNASGVNQIANSTFESNASGWIAEGTLSESGWETTEGFNSARSYHVRAVDRGDNQLNRIRARLNSSLPPQSIGTIRARVRWLKGHPEVLFRLRGNWLEAEGTMMLPTNLGTPGARNSRFAANSGPAIGEVRHAPVLPAAGAAVLITARVSIRERVGSVQLKYRIDPAEAYTTVAMRDDGTGEDAMAGDGIYSATIPGQANGALAAFHVAATDAAQPAVTATYPANAPGREALVRFGEVMPAGTFPVYRIWMTQATFNLWSSRSKLNNTPLPVTFVLGDHRVIYGAQALYAGSPYIAPGYNTPSGRRCGYTVIFPADDRFLGDTDLILDWPGGHGGESTALQEQMAYWMADKMGLPFSHRYTIRLYVQGVSDMARGTVFEAVNQPAGDFLDAWVPEDSEGDFYKIDRAFEFNDAGGLVADPQPRLQSYTTLDGAKKKARYRWMWLKRSTASANNYTNIFHLVDALNASSPEPYTSQTETLIDLEEWMGILALEHIIVNFDAYGHEIGKNMYAYKPRNGKWQLYMFDLDWLMLAAAGRRADYAASSAPLFNSEDPTISRMYQHPPFRRAYFRAVKKAVEGPLLSANCDPVMDAKYQSLRANGVTLCDGQALTPPTVVKTWFRQRRTFLVNQLEALAAPFAISSRGGSAFSTSSNLVTLTGTAPVEVKGLLVNGAAYPVAWTSVTEWALTLPLRPGTNDFALEGYGEEEEVLVGLSDRIRIESTAEAQSPIGHVIVSEILHQPVGPGAEFVELLNTSRDNSFDLSGWRLQGIDFTFPIGSILGAGEHTVIAKDRAAFLAVYGNDIPLAGQFNGNLALEGETLSLLMPGPRGISPVLVDAVTYGTSPPWPGTAPGTSLQLVDPQQENFRSANWAVAREETDPGAGRAWQFVTATGTATSSRLYIYMSSAGQVFLDDIQLVAGATPGAGPNLIANGDFETTFPGPWTVSANLSASSVSSTARHSGSAGLHLVSSSSGSSQNSSVWQEVGPLLSGGTYTLSYWYLPNTNGGALTIRLSGSGISSSHEVAPVETRELLSTPGRANSVLASLPPLPPVWINELAWPGHAGKPDDSGDDEPWMELFNAGTQPVSLDGWHLTQQLSDLTQWPFPPGITLAPKEFLLVWLDGEPRESTASSLHTSFRASPGAGTIALVVPLAGNSTVLDYVDAQAIPPEQSWGLYPDGLGGTWQRLAHPTPGAANDNAALPVSLFINEWMAANTRTLADPADGDFDDWFELFNPGDVAVDLSGYWLSDRLTDQLARWKIPDGSIIGPRGFLLVWADENTEQNSVNASNLHAGFRLSQAGEAIALFAPDGQLLDSVVFGVQTNDVSQGRSPDGAAGLSFFMEPTPGVSNNLAHEPRPEIVGLHFSETGELVLSWTGQTGRTYRVQGTTDLAAGWTDLGEMVAERSTESVLVPQTGAHAFYRVLLED